MKQATVELAGRPLVIETGRVARQADAAVIVRQGETMVLATVQAAPEPKSGADFLPLSVEYRERTGAAGRIPGGFLKREGRPGDHEVLAARILDRTVRPLFPKGYAHEIQLIVTVLSAEPEVDPDVLGLAAGCLALALSPIPWNGPAAGVRVARTAAGWTANPTRAERACSDLDLIVAIGPGGLAMVEGELAEVPEADVIDALEFGARAARPLAELAERWQAEIGKPKAAFAPPVEPAAAAALVAAEIGPAIATAMRTSDKHERHARYRDAIEGLVVRLDPEDPAVPAAAEVRTAAGRLRDRLVRGRIAAEGVRIDGRDPTTVRPISIETSWLPRAHGSSLFTRGETQAMVTCTLAGPSERLWREFLWGREERRFFLHYNFPPFSVGEVRPLRGTGRREIGHGNLAQRALEAVLPPADGFPYTVRVVSDILESNGSSSMATVCGGCLAMMDAGVPISRPVAGVAMGLIREGDSTVVLTDILGDEDHLGDMDFKVCGSERGVTALQMDNKIGSLERAVLEQALAQAREARLHVLAEMAKALPRPRPELAPHAPRVETVWIRPERIREVIGPGGRIIQDLQKTTASSINIENSGRILVFSPDAAGLKAAVARIRELTREAEVGRVYRARVVAVKDFGAFLEIFPGTEGLVHVSEMDAEGGDRMPGNVREGDTLLVRVLGVDDRGKIKLSRRAAAGARPEEIVD